MGDVVSLDDYRKPKPSMASYHGSTDEPLTNGYGQEVPWSLFEPPKPPCDSEPA